MTGGVSAGNMGGGLHFTLQPEISEIDLERERRIENRRGGEVSAGGGRRTGMKRGGRSTQAQLISMGTNKHVQNMSGLWSTRPVGRSTAFEKAFAI